MSLNERSAPVSAQALAVDGPATRGWGWRLSNRGGFWLVAFLVFTGLLGSYTLTRCTPFTRTAGTSPT
jgi:hypothetical protein